MTKLNKKGRSHEPRHARLYNSITGSAAWFDLSGNAIKVLVVLMRLENGSNNGELFLSVRQAAEWANLSTKTARSALCELEDHGFIAATERGHFQRKNSPATKWRLTWISWPAGRKGPTRDFEKWHSTQEPCNKLRRENFPSPVVKIPSAPEIDAVTVVKNTTGEMQNPRDCDVSPEGKITTQTVIPLDALFHEDCLTLRQETRAWLIRTGTRQKRLAGLIGMSEPALSRFLDLNGKRTLPPDQFDRLATIIRSDPKKLAAA